MNIENVFQKGNTFLRKRAGIPCMCFTIWCKIYWPIVLATTPCWWTILGNLIKNRFSKFHNYLLFYRRSNIVYTETEKNREKYNLFSSMNTFHYKLIKNIYVRFFFNSKKCEKIKKKILLKKTIGAFQLTAGD